jgi:hypothetical protein
VSFVNSLPGNRDSPVLIGLNDYKYTKVKKNIDTNMKVMKLQEKKEPVAFFGLICINYIDSYDFYLH